MSSHEHGHIEFERDPNRLDPALTPRNSTEPSIPEGGENRETGRGGKSAPDDRQTDGIPAELRDQQPVTAHQDRRRK